MRTRGSIAVIDLGSNSIRLVIYDGLSRAPVSRFNERRLCGLGSEVAKTGRLGAPGRSCALASLRRFMAIACGAGCAAIDVVATAAFRVAEDGAAFIAEASALLGVPITLLSGEQEATFGAYGIICGFHAPDGIVGDLGGGSVEFAELPFRLDGERLQMSLPLGALVLAEPGRNDPDATARLIGERLDGCSGLRGAARGRAFYVVGGSWRALARARMAIMDHPLRVVHGYALTPGEAETLGRSMSSADPRELARMPGFPRRRIETVPAAGLLLAESVRHLQPQRVIFSATGLREGRIFAQLDEGTRQQDPLLAGTAELGLIANRDPAIADAMIRFTDVLAEREDAVQHRLRQAVCHVADSAWREHPETRAREAFLRLVQYPFLGISHGERVALAMAVFARYEGVRDDPAIRRMLDLAGPTDLDHARLLGQILELGFRASGGIPAIARACRLIHDGDVLRLQADHPAVQADDDAISSRLMAVATGLGLRRVSISG